MNHVVAKVREAARATGGTSARIQQATESRIKSFLEKRIVGIDFNPELVKASKMNMVMNNDGAGGLYQADSLEPPITWDDEIRRRKLAGTVDLIFTNPPFGSKIPVSEPSVLEQYDLGHVWTYNKSDDHWEKTEVVQRSQPPELLFIERCVQFLKPGVGRAAIVLPDGVLGSPGLGYVRQWLLENTRILASVDLHPDTFQPFVGVQTSLLVVQRKTEEQIRLERASGKIADYDVFMAVAEHVGHDKRGNKLYLRDPHGNEIVETVEEQLEEREGDTLVIRARSNQRKVVDDNTPHIAREFRAWLSAQD